MRKEWNIKPQNHLPVSGVELYAAYAAATEIYVNITTQSDTVF